MSIVEVAEPRAKGAHVWARDPLDWYVEPESATEALCRVEGFVGEIIDPCCGQGNIVRALIRAGHKALGTDIVERADASRETWWDGCADFTKAIALPAPNAVFNPPFFRAKGTEAFIRQALALAAGKVCAFVDIRFLAGDARASRLFAEHRPHRAWVITPRASCAPGDYLAAGNKAGNGSSDWLWLVWDKTAPKAVKTETDWLRRGA